MVSVIEIDLSKTLEYTAKHLSARLGMKLLFLTFDRKHLSDTAREQPIYGLMRLNKRLNKNKYPTHPIHLLEKGPMIAAMMQAVIMV